MTDNEIIKALECCKDEGVCTGCPLFEQKTAKCITRLNFYALDLINRQKAEIERLKEANAGLALGLLHDVVNDDPMLRKEITAVAKAEAIREFAERLKDMHKHNTTSVVSLVTLFGNINKMVEEMVGEYDG